MKEATPTSGWPSVVPPPECTLHPLQVGAILLTRFRMGALGPQEGSLELTTIFE